MTTTIERAVANSTREAHFESVVMPAEKALVGTMLATDAEARAVALAEADESMFNVPVHAAIFDVVTELDAEKVIPNPALVAARLKARNVQHNLADLFTLQDHSVTSSYVRGKATILREHQQRSRAIAAIRATGEAFTAAMPGDGTMPEAIAELEEVVHALGENGNPFQVHDPRAVARAGVRFFESMRDGRAPAMTTGIDPLDRVFGGFGPRDLTVLAGLPGTGKTALALQVAHYAATTPWHHLGGRAGVLFISLEMGREHLYARLLANRTGLPWARLADVAQGNGHQEDEDAVHEFDREWSGLDFRVYDGRARTVEEIATKLRAVRLKRSFDLVVVDHLLLLDPGPRGIFEHTTTVTGTFKSLARELGVSVILLSQFNRAGAQSGEPRIHHLKGGSSIEQDSDNVLVMWNKLDESGEPEKDRVNIRIEKARHGEAGAVVNLRHALGLYRMDPMTPSAPPFRKEAIR